MAAARPGVPSSSTPMSCARAAVSPRAAASSSFGNSTRSPSRRTAMPSGCTRNHARGEVMPKDRSVDANSHTSPSRARSCPRPAGSRAAVALAAITALAGAGCSARARGPHHDPAASRGVDRPRVASTHRRSLHRASRASRDVRRGGRVRTPSRSRARRAPRGRPLVRARPRPPRVRRQGRADRREGSRGAGRPAASCGRCARGRRCDVALGRRGARPRRARELGRVGPLHAGRHGRPAEVSRVLREPLQRQLVRRSRVGAPSSSARRGSSSTKRRPSPKSATCEKT